MRQRIAPELDTLMWALVEQGNERAVEEFLVRHPELKAELHRRGKMVTGLKSMRVESEPQVAPPPFRPRENVRPSAPPRMVFAVAVLVLAALGLGSFTVTYLTVPKKDAKTPTTHTTVPAPIPKPEKFTTNPEPTKTEEDPPAVQPGPEDEKNIVNEDRWSSPISIAIQGAPMHAVLQAIGAQSGISVVIAPGTPNPRIDIAYEQRTPMDILKDLGARHGFTPFDQGDGSIIVVPAVETQGKGKVDPATSSTASDPKAVPSSGNCC